MIVAVDGPAGAGKSSIAKLVGKKLNLEYIDSGAIYRSVTKKILDSAIKIDDYTAIENLLVSMKLSLVNGIVFVNGIDYGNEIRSKAVTEKVSLVSAITSVRSFVNGFLNSYAGSKDVIMDGRDIGTEVFPDAEYKFYLDASSDERAKRRCLETGLDMSHVDEIKRSIEQRDHNDMTRKVGPLKKAHDALYIDTTELSIDEVVKNIIECIK